MESIREQHFMLGLMEEVLLKYDVDGIQGDDRWPAMPSSGGYQEWLLRDYGADRPPEPQDPDWPAWRAQALTQHLQEARSLLPRGWLISAPSIQGWAYRESLQDWTDWLQKDLVDWVHPQAYRRSLADYQACLRPLLSQFTPTQRLRVASYRVTPSLLLEMIRWNRECGFGGEALFFYEGLRANQDELGEALSKGPYRAPAQCPQGLLQVLAPSPFQAGRLSWWAQRHRGGRRSGGGGQQSGSTYGQAGQVAHGAITTRFSGDRRPGQVAGPVRPVTPP